MSVTYFLANGGNKVHWTNCSGVKRSEIRAGSLHKHTISYASVKLSDVCAFCASSAPENRPDVAKLDDAVVIDLVDDRRAHGEVHKRTDDARSEKDYAFRAKVSQLAELLEKWTGDEGSKKRVREVDNEHPSVATKRGRSHVARYRRKGGEYCATVRFMDGTKATYASPSLDELNEKVGQLIKSAYE